MHRARFDVVPPSPRITESADRLDRQRTVSWGALSAGLIGADQSETSIGQGAERLGIVSLVIHLDRARPRSDRERSPFQLRRNNADGQ